MISNKFNLKKTAALICAFAVSAAAVQSGADVSATFSSSYLDTENVSVTINTAKGHKPISPYIYGINAESDLSGVTINAVKQTDSRVSSYNWETNFSGIFVNSEEVNDLDLIDNYPQNRWSEPALYTEYLITKAKRYGISSRYVTLQMLGFAAAGDMRWEKVLFSKNDSYLSQPDTDDGAVYADEYISFLVNKYGYAVDGGINGYFLDNEPENWAERFPSAASEQITADELVTRSAVLSSAVKKIDPTALVYGPSINGIEAFINLKNPGDWEKYGNDYSWFIDYYLKSMNDASQEAGVRLLDVLDLHYHTEATNGLLEPIINGTDNFSNNTRLQAPRILWDSSYTENSTIAILHNQHIPLIPTLEASINMYYPGTKLSFSEYNFGGGNHISGGIATADTLGIFASYGVHMACLKPNSSEIEYQKSAINLYTNYDGEGGSFGDTFVRSDNGGDIMSSVYASIDNSDETALKAVLINKNQTTPKNVHISIKSAADFDSVKIYGFNEESPEIFVVEEEIEVGNNSLEFEMEPLSVYMMVFSGTGDEITVEDIPPVSEEITLPEESSSESITVTEKAETSASLPEHVEAETYSSAGTSLSDAASETETEATSISVVGTTPEGETVTEIVAAEKIPEETEFQSESKVPKAVKVIVCTLVGAVAVAMLYILFSGNRKSDM